MRLALSTPLLAAITAFGLCFLFSGEGRAQASATAEDLVAGRQYEGGARVRHAATGVAWQVPAGWIGGIPQGSAVFLLGSNVEAGVGILIPIGTSDPESLATLLHETQDLGDGVVLEPVGEPGRRGKRLSQAYRGGEYVGRALAVPGPGGESLVCCFAGPAAQAGRFDELLEQVAASIRFSEPDVAPLLAEWRERLQGMALRTMSSYNSGGGSGGYSSESTLDLCPDGAFRYYSAGATSMYVPGASGTGVHEESSSGRWTLAVESGGPVLVLEHEDGQTTRHALGYDGEKTFLDGERVFRVESENCR